MEDNLIIKLSNIQKIYDLGKFDTKYFIRKFMSKKRITTLTALENITLNIEKNERIALIGDNGAGKSTLLKIISKITMPTSGSIELNGVVCSLLEAGVGFHPELNGIENIFLNGTILGMTLKLALAIILNLDAQILIMDEIMAVVDNDYKKKCIKEILSLVEQKKRTLLFVSHQLDTVKQLCERGILIDNGKIIMDDKIEKVLDYYSSISKSN